MSAILERKRRRWWIVFGSTLGLVFSTGPLLQFTFGVFIKPVAEAFRTDRGSVSLAPAAIDSLRGDRTLRTKRESDGGSKPIVIRHSYDALRRLHQVVYTESRLKLGAKH